MRMLTFVFFLYACLYGPGVQALNAQVADHCMPFTLDDIRGKSHSLDAIQLPYKVLAFLGAECPLAKLYVARLNEISDEFATQVQVLGLNANQQDSISDIALYVKKIGPEFPVLKDVGAVVADQLGAQRTPEVFLLDAQNRIRYRGRIDDQYGVGYTRPKPTRQDLRIAIQELIKHDNVSIEMTEPVGCFIGRRASKQPTGDISYAGDVVPILREHCVDCHRDGQIAPFSLTEYDEVVGWSETIREVVENRRMPPWHASPMHGEFANERSLPTEEQRTLFAWIENGMPRGNDGELPKLEELPSGWNLPRKPDMEIAMAQTAFTVPAEGTVEYQYFVADPGFTEDKWVVAAEVMPGDRSVVHHAIVFVRPPAGERQQGIGWLTAYVPGQTLFSLPSGMARRVPKGSQLVFQIHYTPIGTLAKDRTKVGLVFASDESIHTEVETRLVLDRDFEIPAGAKEFRVSMSDSQFPTGSKLLAIAPHMHYRGKSFRVTAESEHADKILLDVPNYDFNWQHAYLLAERLPLDNVTLRCVATFDNSSENRVNPDPTQSVRWGDQTWEEMAMAYLAIAVPRHVSTPDGSQVDRRIVSKKERRRLSIEKREREAKVIATQFFEKLDANEDGEILRAETPASFRAFAWRLYDTNKDDKLDWEEVLSRARLSLRP